MSESLDIELALLREAVQAGFARADRYFELQQAQYVELRTDVNGLRAEVRASALRLDRIEERLTSVEHQVANLRDWAAREFSDLRLEVRRLREDVVARNESLQAEVDGLSARVTLLERHCAERQG